jgi:hypothetical protein
MIEFFIPVLVGVLLAATVVASIQYLKQIRRAQKEYETAKSAVVDIVMSFNRELKRESDRLEAIAFKIESSTTKADTALKRVESVEKMTEPMESQIEIATQNSSNILSEVKELEVKIINIETTQETLGKKISGFDEQLQKFAVPPETNGEPVMPVMPIKRDKAMAALTDTEIAVLEMLSSEGPKTAPEIKEKVQLSREHTARLMKKLYEGGYLERETGKIPFRYSVKKEMEKLLKKPEQTNQS